MKDDSFRVFVLDQLSGLGEVVSRPMFGGYGLYRRGIFFGIVFKGRLFLKTDDATRPEYVSRGMAPFRPNARQTLKRYYEVPADVLEDPDLLATWAERATKAREAGIQGAKKNPRAEKNPDDRVPRPEPRD